MSKNSIILFVLLTCLFAKAQEKEVAYASKPLRAVIQELEDTYPIRFSFNNAIIKAKTITYKGALNLDSILEVITVQNKLDFEYLDNENIIIKVIDEEAEYILPQKLDEVLVVTEYITSGFDQNKKDGSITLTPKKIGVLPGLIEADVMQSLQLLPGISSPTESATNLHIRGGTPDQNLVLWDGIKMYHQGHLFGMISAFNPYITERVDVYRSGVSAQYGDRIAGIIDMHSSEDLLEEASAGLGSNFLTANAFVKVPIVKEKLGVLFSARRALTDVLDSPTFSKFGDKVFQNTKIEETNQLQQEEELTVLNDKFYYTDFNVKALWQISDKHSISASSLFVTNKLDYANQDELGEGSSDKLDLSNNGFSIASESYLGTKWKVTSNLHYSDYQSEYNLNEFFSDSENEGYNRLNTIEDLGAVIQSRYNINERSSLLLGTEYTHNKAAFTIDFVDEDEADEIQRNTMDTFSLFSEYTRSSDVFTLKPGLRISSFSKVGKIYLEPRLYADYQLSETTKLKVSGEVKNQSLSQLVNFEFNDLQLADNIWALTDDDDDIPLLNNRQFTAGFLVNHKGWKIDVEGYYRHTKGITSFTRGFNSNSISSNYTSGESDTYGLDILIKKRIKRFRTWLSYSLSKTDFRFDEIQSSSFSGNFDQRHVVTLSGTYKVKNWQVSLGWNMATGKPFSRPLGIETIVNEDNDQEDVLVYESLNNERLTTYHRLDASVIYDFRLGRSRNTKARVGISVLNLYDKRNQIDKTFLLENDTETSSEIVQQTEIGLGITPNVVFRVTF